MVLGGIAETGTRNREFGETANSDGVYGGGTGNSRGSSASDAHIGRLKPDGRRASRVTLAMVTGNEQHFYCQGRGNGNEIY
ncbi:unnamed protein product [Fusarium venenatum]|uniref:Uncharacterized protein n=1 Tax=Fusarium venenatum TaxID=56646 RepID=A0A2L2TGH5_9HYPO|nr:uncharacterized protein FVRRES_00029 [Fusarium venenatum]CEI63517.1 unnamed protein product [Fusarium venenatum]